MKMFHFDLGNSTTGPVGISGAIRAESKQEAVDELREKLAHLIDGQSLEIEGIEYVRAYVNANCLTERDMEEGED